MNEKIPDPVSEQERWIVHHRPDSIRVEYRQTGADTAETYVHLSEREQTVCWLDRTFRAVADLDLSHASIAKPEYGVRERVLDREKYEKNNAAELATYRRLKAKFEGPK